MADASPATTMALNADSYTAIAYVRVETRAERLMRLSNALADSLAFSMERGWFDFANPRHCEICEAADELASMARIHADIQRALGIADPADAILTTGAAHG